ncbi:DUF697 domain-containing protein [Streptomyces sp. SID12488]|uniref:DUF697 domain-containing protein n=1 Tax=Streptomyces sp. SID12488 TaxID=2706040 RepID=UPI0013DA4B67|nr:DUF697 domain-containing protein [Streptomyces sp. SID12488]
MTDEYDFDAFERIIKEHVEEQLGKLGKFNLVLFGDSGAGKSTLVNAVFGLNLAETGVGDPVTTEIVLHRRHEDDPLGIYDCPGFEVATGDLDQVVEQVSEIVHSSRQKSEAEWIHAAWFVVNHRNNRFLPAHVELVRALADMDLPVFLVLTHVARVGQDIESNALALSREIVAKQLPLAAEGQIFLVNSQELDLPGGAKYPVHGMKDLLDATVEAIPEAARRAALAAQRLDFTHQRMEALQAVERAKKMAQATQFIPVPGADMAGFAVILSRLVVEISVVYGVPLSRKQLAGLTWTAFIGGTVSKQGTGWLVKEAAKRLGQQMGRNIPFVGTAVNAASAAAAGPLTVAVGHAWIAVCEFVRTKAKRIEDTHGVDLIELFKRYYEQRSRSE